MKKTKLRIKGVSTTAQLKDDIQHLVRLIVTIRDGGCVLRDLRCHITAHVEDNKVVSDAVIQADHLVTRSNSATFADPRLIVCVCKGCHGWKHWNEKEYDNLVKTVLPQDRLDLWERAEKDHQAHKTHKMDWAMERLVLERELAKMTQI